MDQLREYQAGVAGCVPLMLHTDLPRVIETLNRQLSAHYTELRQLAAQPTVSFAPTQWPVEAIGDDVIDAEDEKLDRIFSLFEKLYCFELGIEELRVFMISEDDPEFHVPSTAFYDALISISSHTLLATLDAAEPKLRAIIVKLWSETTMEYTGQPYYRQRSDAPDSFWWRHHKPRARRPQQRRQNGSNRRPPRTSR